jgi:hypothetical protein
VILVENQTDSVEDLVADFLGNLWHRTCGTQSVVTRELRGEQELYCEHCGWFIHPLHAAKVVADFEPGHELF